jgi:hypothetical protein
MFVNQSETVSDLGFALVTWRTFVYNWLRVSSLIGRSMVVRACEP